MTFPALTCPPVVTPHLGWFRSVDSGGTYRSPFPPRLLSCREGPLGSRSWMICRESKEATNTVATTAGLGLLGLDTSCLSQFARESHSFVSSKERTAAPRSIPLHETPARGRLEGLEADRNSECKISPRRKCTVNCMVCTLTSNHIRHPICILLWQKYSILMFIVFYNPFIFYMMEMLYI